VSHLAKLRKVAPQRIYKNIRVSKRTRPSTAHHATPMHNSYLRWCPS
jgi:hypothetical protein